MNRNSEVVKLAMKVRDVEAEIQAHEEGAERRAARVAKNPSKYAARAAEMDKKNEEKKAWLKNAKEKLGEEKEVL